MKKLSPNVVAGGKLVLDAQTLEAVKTTQAAAVRGTLVKLVQQVEKTATPEPATTGNVGLSLSQWMQRAGVL